MHASIFQTTQVFSMNPAAYNQIRQRLANVTGQLEALKVRVSELEAKEMPRRPGRPRKLAQQEEPQRAAE